MARKWGVKMGRPAGSEYLSIPEDTGCVAAPKCLTMPGAQVPGRHDLRRAGQVERQRNARNWFENCSRKNA